MQAPPHVAAALAFPLMSITQHNLDLEHYVSGSVEARDELQRLLAAISGGSDTQLGVSDLRDDDHSVQLVLHSTQLNCKPLLQQLAVSAPPGSSAHVPGAAKALLETLAHLVSLPILGEP